MRTGLAERCQPISEALYEGMSRDTFSPPQERADTLVASSPCVPTVDAFRREPMCGSGFLSAFISRDHAAAVRS